HGNFCAVGYHNPKREKVSGPMGSNPPAIAQIPAVCFIIVSLFLYMLEWASQLWREQGGLQSTTCRFVTAFRVVSPNM
ncbi:MULTISPECIES: hypothetical protein, partial [unclassified Aeromonas]|uniref:hypothetical protein n=1 Tax=unclassified Aeromonas TaxID=257493 RepID=UPI0022E47EE5